MTGQFSSYDLIFRDFKEFSTLSIVRPHRVCALARGSIFHDSFGHVVERLSAAVGPSLGRMSKSDPVASRD